MSDEVKLNGSDDESERLRRLGVQLRQAGRLAEAVETFRHGLSLAADDALAWSELAHALRWQEKLPEAHAAAQRALELHPDHAPAWFNLGAVLVEQEQTARGIAAYRRALQLKPDFAEAWSNLGLALGSAGNRDEAIAAFRRSLEINPRLAPVWNNLGGALSETGCFDDAVDAYRHAVTIEPDYAQGWSNLANAYCEAGEFSEALAACERALRLDPNMAPAWNNLGAARMAGGEFAAAVDAYRRALELDSRPAQIWSGMGGALLRLGSIAEAIAAQRRATELAPDDARWWRNLAHALWVGHQLADAIEALRHALILRPSHAGIRADLIYQLMAVCDWRDLDAQLDLLGHGVEAMPPGEEETPHGNLMHCEDEACNLAVAQRWSERVAARFSPAFAVRDRPPAGDRITIGYLSSDIHDHATAHLMRGVFRLHDHAQFRIHTYSYGPDDGSAVRAELRAASDVFRDIRALGHRDAAAQIAADRVDILVDLKGWTQGVRYEICALRPAPLQITYLGFPGSCGAEFIDYAIVDDVVVPSASVRYYSEQLISLPQCYQANDDQQPIADSAYSRADFGLPEHGAVLCSFNGCQKLDPLIFATWMRVLRLAPDAVLWLLASNRWAIDNLTQQARDHGIDPARLVFAQALPRPQHLRRLQLADIALDTRICNGHTTTSDALWAGVPVLTLRGHHFASRVSASCLGAIGMPELVAGTLDEYENLAVRLATERVFLGATKAKLLNNRKSQPLFDTRRFTRNLERAYMQAWQHHRSGQAPRSFSVQEAGPPHEN